MARSFETLRKSMSPERRQANEEVAEAILVVMDLPELRGALDITQIELAARLEIAQSNVSRLEHRDDMLVSTLREVIRALGGELELVLRYDKHEWLRVTGYRHRGYALKGKPGPKWHAQVWLLRRAWTPDAKIGPTWNAYVNGAGWWRQGGARAAAIDRAADPLGKVGICRADDADIHADRFVGSDADDLAVFQNAKQLCLHCQRHVADFIEEQRPAVCMFESAEPVGSRAGIGTLNVAEKFVFKQRLGKPCTVDRNESVFRSVGVLVDRACQQFLTRARFAQQQYGDI